MRSPDRLTTNMKYKLIAADLDGTLLNDESVMTERTKQAVIRTAREGVLFVAATGRPMCGVEFINALFDADLPFIIFNGATVIMGKSKKMLFNLHLDASHVKEIYDLGLNRNIPMVMWIGEQLWVSHDCEAIRDYQRITFAKMQIIKNIARPSVASSQESGVRGQNKTLDINDANGSREKVCQKSKPVEDNTIARPSVASSQESGVRSQNITLDTTDTNVFGEKVCQKNKLIENNTIDRLADFGVSKMLWIDTAENIRTFQDEMNDYFQGRVNCHISRPKFLEFVNAGADKGTAMKQIGEIYGIDRQEMIAIGDSYNDISMLKYAGLGVAMENAPNDIKAVCQYITLSNNEDGVAEVIDRYI